MPLVGSLNKLATHAQMRVRARNFQQHGDDDDGESIVEAAQAPTPKTWEWRSLMAVLALAGILRVRCFGIECHVHTATHSSSTTSRVHIVTGFLNYVLFFSFCSSSWALSQRQSFAWQSQENSLRCS